jgi:hypothetical protein
LINDGRIHPLNRMKEYRGLEEKSRIRNGD